MNASADMSRGRRDERGIEVVERLASVVKDIQHALDIEVRWPAGSSRHAHIVSAHNDETPPASLTGRGVGGVVDGGANLRTAAQAVARAG
ncbi:MAG: hypothetical protein ABS60_14140 [Microbacterium sp. SCN 71-17]|nr:MAG: hypothetical protein ABS60_14140 [Microbacterium sp. SCN 71-17]